MRSASSRGAGRCCAPRLPVQRGVRTTAAGRAHRSGCAAEVTAAEDLARRQAPAAHLRLLRRQGNVDRPGRVLHRRRGGQLSGRRVHRQGKHSPAPVPQCRQRADGRGGPGEQPPLQPHEHPAGGAPGSRRATPQRDAGARWQCSAASMAARPGPRACTRCSTARKTASGKSRSWTTTRGSARRMQPAGLRHRPQPRHPHRARGECLRIRPTGSAAGNARAFRPPASRPSAMPIPARRREAPYGMPLPLLPPGAGDARAQVAELLRRADRLRDQQEIENLQRIYGYYYDRAQWDQMADLFAEQWHDRVCPAGRLCRSQARTPVPGNAGTSWTDTGLAQRPHAAADRGQRQRGWAQCAFPQP